MSNLTKQVQLTRQDNQTEKVQPQTTNKIRGNFFYQQPNNNIKKKGKKTRDK